MGTEGISIVFSEDAIDEMAQIAYDLNRRTQNIGARRLYTILERVIEKISFESGDTREKRLEITANYVKDRLKDVLGDEDLSKFIL
jgi:ATP-dependent HslUV protease ATP-binding subunit HslU